MPTLRPTPRPLLLTLALLGLCAQTARADEPTGFPAPSGPTAPPTPEGPPPATPRPAAASQSHLPPPQTRYFPPGAAVTGTSGSIGPAPVYESRDGAGTYPTAESVRRAPAGTGIVEVTPREVLAPSGGGTEFQVKFRVVGDAGRQFYLNAVFLDPATGQAVAAHRPAFGDRSSGALYLLLTPVSHPGGSAEYRGLLQLPSDTMAPLAAGTEHRVEARVQLFRRGLAGAADESMDWVMVPFTVRGPAAASAPAVSPSGLRSGVPAPGFGSTAPSSSFSPPIPPGPNAAAAAQAPGATRIVSLTKNHNQSYPDGRLGLRLDVPYEIAGERGRAFYLHALFFDRATSQAIQSTRPEFADHSSGALYLITQPSPNNAPDGQYRTSLWVPYDAFPRPAPGTTLSIECRVTLFRRDPGAAMDTAMDLSTVTFQVHGE